MKIQTKKSIVVILCFTILCIISVVFAGTTGKISGLVIDKNTKEPLPDANIILRSTSLGAASDNDGRYNILMIPPGTYTMEISYVGYKPYIINNIKVSIDKTTKINIEMEELVIEGDVVTITAEKPVIKIDLTSSESVIDAEKIQQLPVENFSEIVNLQAGVVDGHFRGGRRGEVTYMIDGIPVNDVYSGSYAVQVENAAISELEVISGTFNAEYGQAMSGVVNIVTKEGSKEKYEGELDVYSGSYFSTHDNIFWNLDKFHPIGNFQGVLSGPVPNTNSKLTFYLSGRYFDNPGFIYGKNVFRPSDQSDFTQGNMEEWIIEAQGQTYNYSGETAKDLIDNADYESMNHEKRYTADMKLTYHLSGVDKISYRGLMQKSDMNYYDHNFRLNPVGNYNYEQTGYSHAAIWTHMFGKNTFSTLKIARFQNDYKQYVYEDYNSPEYVSVYRLQDTGANAFYSGGQQMWHFNRSTTTNILKFDVSSQLTNSHQVKAGFEGKMHQLKLHEYEVLTQGDSRIPPITSYNNNQYDIKPMEGAVYIQDKMEFDYMVVNAGVRFDYFEPDWHYPIDFSAPSESETKEAKNSMQVSPRFGIAYPITDKGAIHVSYGHFFQIPNYQYLYLNPEFNIIPLQSVPAPPPQSMLNTVGNAELKPQKTVIYEIGLQQALTEEIGLTVTSFYKDIRNLLGTEVLYTLQGVRYGRYINRDYGNVKGITFSLEKRHFNNVSATLDYTYQIAKGNASDPNTAFLDQQTDPPKQTVKQLVPLNWDRRHQVNLTVTYGNTESYAVSLIGRLGTGMPYTPSYQNIQTAVENSGRKPTIYNFDFFAYKNLSFQGFNYQFYIRGYNIFDRLNEINIFNDTGRAGYTLAPQYVGGLHPRGINELNDYYIMPNYYSEPRKIQAGVKVSF